MELLSRWRRGVVVGALAALTVATTLVAPATASAASTTSTRSTTAKVVTGGAHTGSAGKSHNIWEW